SIVGSSRDITDRKRFEEALRLANRQLGLLTGITRHDIQNKITVILGYLKVAEMESPGPFLMEVFGKMESATNAIRSQIEFTRTYQDLGVQEPRWITLDTVMPPPQILPTVSLITDVEGISLYADAMLEKVFSNLFDNSLRHGQRVTEIRVSYRMSGEDLVVVWEDNGIGIADKEKERIFDPGFGKNTGLGMYLAREILSLTGITIRETGEAGKGARFEITAPKGHYRIAPPPGA
ncbi:MAG: HAMP domain-containing histidine kinase, partial [Methanolinea sp.]|nr:HAMP domain-containing histidine kinase [Methanolinea sp.]